MLGTKLYKSKKSDMAKYTNSAVWCNANNAHIVDQGEYYEVIENIVHEPTKAELIAQLDAQYASDKSALMDYYMQAMIADDTDTMAEIKQELADLAEQYDNDMKELEE